MTSSQPNSTNLDGYLDAVIVGGGIAGLWLLNLLNASGYRVLLLEAQTLGSGQTLASQGMIHGGLKYALGGSLTGASEAIAGMPQAWRNCLQGTGSVDLSGLPMLSERYYMFAEATTLGRLTGFFASKTLRGRIERLTPPGYPEALRPFTGVVYQLNDFVLDTCALLARLLEPVGHLAYQHQVQATQLQPTATGWQVSAANTRLNARKLILCAGTGNGPLLKALGLNEPQMQTRPLHQVLVRHSALRPLYAHCLTGISRPEPRLTITSHPDGPGWLWYLGGRLATAGVELAPDDLIDHARRELTRCVPWIDWREARFDTLRIDRAEPLQSAGTRPDEAFTGESANCIVCWPTKLSLAPDLGTGVLSALPPPADDDRGDAPRLDLPPARLGTVPWEIPA